MMALRETPLCSATLRKIELNVPSSNRIVGRDSEALVSRLGCFQDDVTADLVHRRVPPSPTQNIGEMRA
jgi:hypothetical protein